MTDDIVTRLREKYAGQLPICTEAADEIERLRAEILKIGRAYGKAVDYIGRVGGE